MSVSFLIPISYLPFLALVSVVSLFSLIAWSDFKAFWSCEIKVHQYGYLVQHIDSVFIKAVMCKLS